MTPYSFKILRHDEIESIIPLMQKFTNHKFSDALLKQRFSEMVTQNYECAAIFNRSALIGVCGMWFCTRHYSGRSVEVDHVYIDGDYRGKGLGKLFFKWIYDYVKQKGYEAVELNSYVQNHPSHKFYYNEGFNILGYHFVKNL